MAKKTYLKLTANRRFLRGIGVGSADFDVPHDERIDAENLATAEIDGALAKQWTAAPNAPPIIGLLADLIGSAYLLEFVALGHEFGETGEGRFKPDFLRERAQAIIDDLRSHKQGVQNEDGTWDSDYPQPSILPLAISGGSRPITIDPGLTWGQMAQPVMNDDEKNALDVDRERRSDAMRASLAGSYGL